MAIADAKDFNLSTDFPLDKVVFFSSGSFTVPNMTLGRVDIPHDLSFTPLAFGNWSLTSDFDVSYEFGSGPPNTSNPQSSAFRLDPRLTSTSSIVRVEQGNYFFGGTATIYYRVFCLQPTTAAPTPIPFTNAGVDDFMINTDQIQVQLIDAGIHDFPNVFGASYIVTLLDHNLGYRPQVMAWIERDGFIEHKYMAATGFGSVDVIPTTTDVSLRVVASSLGGRLHYRIYVNE